MKKYVKITALCLALTCLLGISAFAAGDTVKKGIGPITNNITGITVTVGTGNTGTIDGVTVTDAETLTLSYPDAVKDAQYMVFLLSGASGAPTDSNIAYIYQEAAGDTGVEFTIYPNELKKGDYRVILTCASDDKVGINNPVASFAYKQAYKLGDVDGENGLNSYDASLILQNLVDKYEFVENGELAADVDGENGVNSYDASLILQHLVGTYTIPGWED